MKKKKILLTGLLGVSILAAGITLASCNSIPLTPYEPSSSTAPVAPTPSSSSVVPTPSSVEPVTPSTSEVTPSPSSEVTPTPSSSQDTPEVGNEVSFDATKLTTGDTYVEGGADTTEEKAEVTAAELCNGFFTQVIEGSGKIVKRSKQYSVDGTKNYSSECVAIEASAGCGLEFTVTHAVKLSLSLQSTSSSNKSIFALFKDDVAVAAKTASLTNNGTANHYVITGSKVDIEYELEAGTYEMLYLDEKAAESDSATVNRGGRFFTIKTEEIDLTQKYSITYVSTYGMKPANIVEATELTENDLPALEDTNYDFGGWYTDENFQTEAVAGALSANVTLYAKWTIKASVTTVDVTFVFDNGTENSVVPVAEGSKVTKPNDPTKTGYAFDGWFLENATEPFDFDTTISAATTLTARYHQVFSITFENAQGDSPAIVTNVTKITVADLPKLSKDYFAFKGWAIKETTDIITADTDLTDNVVLVAQWDVIPTYQDFYAHKDDGSYGYGVLDDLEGRTPEDKNAIPNWSQRNYMNVIYQDRKAKSSTVTPSADNNYAYIKDGSIILYDKGKVGDDADDECSTKVILDTDINTGIAEAIFDVKITTLGTGWTFLQVYGTDTAKTDVNEVFGIRVDSGNAIKYRVDGGSATAGLNSITAAKDTTYQIYLRVDLDNSKVSASINGKEIVTDLSIEGLGTIDYILFTSSDGGNKSLSISNIAINHILTALSETKEYFKSKLDKIATNYDLTLYDENGKEITDTVAHYKDTMDACDNNNDVSEEFFAAYAALMSVRTTAQKALDKAKDDARKEIGQYLDATSTEMFAVSGYSYTDGTETVTLADYDALDQMLEDALEAVTTIDEITNDTTGIVVTFKNSIDLISDTNADMIAYYKDYVKNDLLGNYPSTRYTANATEYQAAVNALDGDLSTATTKSTIDKAISDAYLRFGSIKMDSAQLIAKNELIDHVSKEVAKLLCADEINDENNTAFDEFRSQINEALNDQIKLIEKAADDQVESVFTGAISAIDGEIADVASKTDLTVTFVSDVVTIASIEHVKFGEKITEPVVSASDLVVDTTSTNGLKLTYEIEGYYLESTCENGWVFNSQTVDATHKIIYVNTRVVKYEYEPKTNDDVSIFDITSTTKYDNGLKLGTNTDKLEFTLGMTAVVRINVTASSGSDGAGLVVSKTINSAETEIYSISGIESSKNINAPTLNVAQTGETKYTIKRYSGKTTRVKGVVVEIEYGTPVTLTQKIPGSNDVETLITSGATVQLDQLEKQGFVFDGWYETLTGDVYSDKIDATSLVVPANKTIYAKFTPITYNATFELNGGEYNSLPDNPTQNDIAYNGTITKITPAKTGYIFLGWFTKDGSGDDWGEEYDFTTALTTLPEVGDYSVNITLYAKWLDENDAEKSTVNFDLNGGTHASAVAGVVTVGGDTGNIYKNYSKVTALADVTAPTDKEFDGWYTKNGKDTGDWGTKYDFDEFVTVDTLTLYAKWYDNISTLQSIICKAVSTTPTTGTLLSAGGITVAKTGSQGLSIAEKAATSGDSKYTFTHAILPTGNGGTYIVSSSKNTTITIYFTITDSKWSNKNANLFVNETQSTSYDSSNKCPGANPVAYELVMTKDTNYTLSANDGRLTIWGFEYSDTQKVNVQSMSATVASSDNAIAISNVKLTPIGDNQTDISITNGYYVHIKKHGEGDDYAVVKDAQNIQIGAGTYDVFVKYGDYTVYAEEGVVVTGTEAFDTETTINFGSNGNYTTFENLTYTSKSNDQDGESQFGYTDAGKELSFYVKAGAFIKVNSHGGAYTHYTLAINGEVSSEQTGTTYSAFTPNPTKVTILSTAADNYISSIEITYPNFITTSKQLILGSDNTDLVDLCDEDASSNKIIQGKTVSLDGFTIDTTNGKVRLNGGDNSQVNTGTKIIFFVKANSVVTVEGYPGMFAYSINGVNAVDATTSVAITEDSMITVLATDSQYLKSISVSYPKFLSSKTITFGNDSTFESAKTNLDVTSTVTTANHDGYAQVKEGKISFVVSENTEVTIVGYYSVDYDINGTLVQGKTADELTKTFTFTEATVVTINCQTVENSYGDGNYFTSITINEK